MIDMFCVWTLEWRQISFTLLLVNCHDVAVEFIKLSESLTKVRTMFSFSAALWMTP